jgi:hypothetical protein
MTEELLSQKEGTVSFLFQVIAEIQKVSLLCFRKTTICAVENLIILFSVTRICHGSGLPNLLHFPKFVV